ncbi:MAG TPA: 50S ribosomal protein L18e [Candidatus Nanopusillus sp.]|nr:50S ribosomal protein L18e [Candidatus Nanopusillus sp.]HIP90380.1 50S ribosomal protein L18e [Candidatus Nanopusillus sp.]
MVKRTGPTNVHLRKLIRFLERASNENEARIWRYVAELLSKPTRQKIEVNLGKIDRYTKEGDIIVVPGKVLGVGKLTKRVTIAAWKFSENASLKARRSGANVITIEELVKSNPTGSNIKIII